MKKVIVFMICILLLGINLPAEAGDLIVEGKVGIGNSTPIAKLDILSGNAEGLPDNDDNLSSVARLDYGPLKAIYAVAEKWNTNTDPDITAGLNAFGFHYGSGNLTNSLGLLGGRYHAFKNASGGTITHAKGVHSSAGFFVSGITGTITNAYAFFAAENRAHSGTITNSYNFYGTAATKGSGTLTNAYGIFLEKQTAGTNNFGIVLNGDGTGADLVLGANKETKLYGSSGNLIVNTAGKVGIGTTNPTAKLQVADGDAYTSTAGNGLIVKSPNGAICKRIGIDNSGNIVATDVTCP